MERSASSDVKSVHTPQLGRRCSSTSSNGILTMPLVVCITNWFDKRICLISDDLMLYSFSKWSSKVECENVPKQKSPMLIFKLGPILCCQASILRSARIWQGTPTYAILDLPYPVTAVPNAFATDEGKNLVPT